MLRTVLTVSDWLLVVAVAEALPDELLLVDVLGALAPEISTWCPTFWLSSELSPDSW